MDEPLHETDCESVWLDLGSLHNMSEIGHYPTHKQASINLDLCDEQLTLLASKGWPLITNRDRDAQEFQP